jgi:Amt family ammonium transporter
MRAASTLNLGETRKKHPAITLRVMEKVDTGDTAWLLVSAALVLLMTPALALFYGGMVSRKNVLSTIMHSLVALPIVSILWALFGYSLAFGTSRGGLIGGADFLGLSGLAGQAKGTVPTLAFAAFQMMFAVITPALISGAFAERMKFSAYVLFVALWTTLVYFPVAHWVWAEGGWLLKLGALDFAGGTVVHLTAGISALVCALVIGKRVNYPHRKPLPHNLTMTLTGAGILWFGWFGFNAGSALGAGHLAALSFLATHLGAAGGAAGWLVVEARHRGKPTALGAASGLVAGLVAITPAAGFVAPWAAIVIGLLSGGVCYLAVSLKERLGYDDSLDAFGVHGVGGLLGALLTGVFAQKSLNDAGADGLLSGNPRQLGLQALACLAAAAYAVVLTLAILKLIDALVGLRVSRDDEREGLDVNLHGEEGYVLSSHGTFTGSAREEDDAPTPAASSSLTAEGA